MVSAPAPAQGRAHTHHATRAHIHTRTRTLHTLSHRSARRPTHARMTTCLLTRMPRVEDETACACSPTRQKFTCAYQRGAVRGLYCTSRRGCSAASDGRGACTASARSLHGSQRGGARGFDGTIQDWRGAARNQSGGEQRPLRLHRFVAGCKLTRLPPDPPDPAPVQVIQEVMKEYGSMFTYEVLPEGGSRPPARPASPSSSAAMLSAETAGEGRADMQLGQPAAGLPNPPRVRAPPGRGATLPSPTSGVY